MKKRKVFSALLLVVIMLLPSCGEKTPAPTEKPSDAVSRTGSETPSDTTSEEKPFRSLTDEEAEALFGHANSPVSKIDGDYCYFMDVASDNGYTMCRYHYDTGEIEYVCRKPGCTHTEGSGCPLYLANGHNAPLCVSDGKVVLYKMGDYIPGTDTSDGIADRGDASFIWYDMQTNESREHTAFERSPTVFCYRAGNSFYCEAYLYDRATASSRTELWKFDMTGGEPTLAATFDGEDKRIIPYLVNGEEVFLGFSRTDVPSGETPSNRWWIYRIDENTGERSLFYEKSVSNYLVDICGNMLLYADYDTDWFLTHDPEDDAPMPKTLRLVDLSTGEEKILAENVTDLYNYLLTDRCVMYMLNDPTEENAFILHCYNYLTGEKTEYPLKGKRWRGYNFYYDRGQLYSLDLSLLDENGNPVRHGTLVTLVVWDIATGAQREIYKNKIVKEIR